ncbi:ferredoxin [Mycobacterium sp. OTB74]|nr:ferredoxin [Mycobacterium sp. OTB74]
MSSEDQMRVKLDRTLCDGFGICAKHAPEYFSLDDWGYAVLVGDGNIPPQDQPAVLRALLDCPVHAIIELSDRKSDSKPEVDNEPMTNEAEWGFTR